MLSNSGCQHSGKPENLQAAQPMRMGASAVIDRHWKASRNPGEPLVYGPCGKTKEADVGKGWRHNNRVDVLTSKT